MKRKGDYMKFENTRVMNFDGALRGMRNPMNSWDKSDSRWERVIIFNDGVHSDGTPIENVDEMQFIIGENDLTLAQKLIRAGSEHRKFMRQIFVCVDITAPLYWWKEFDTYKVGTVANSTSTMHKLATTPITLDCFDIDDYNADLIAEDPVGEDDHTMTRQEYLYTISEIVGKNEYNFYSENTIIGFLENLRLQYNKTKDKRYWKELIRWLPESWLQTRTVTLNYENLLAMCSKGQRRFHKLNEWSGQDNPSLPNFISWARTLPYAQKLIFIDELQETINA